MLSATIVTCSYLADLEFCRLLCDSFDRFAAPDIEHRLYVPRRDLKAFAAFASPRRRIEPQESLLPRWFWQAPLPGPVWRRRLRLPRRNVYLTPLHGPVRGWIAQQIMKITAALQAPTEVVAHLDSDAAIVQPLRCDHLAKAGRTRIYAGPVETRHDGHALWYAAAARLLGLPAGDVYDREYIAPLVVWRQTVVAAMTQRIEATTGRGWASALAATPQFSEYVLYGAFAERALGLEAAGLQRDARSLCLARWGGGFDDEAQVAGFLAQLDADDLVCCLQSTIEIKLATRAAIFDRAAQALASRRPAAAA